MSEQPKILMLKGLPASGKTSHARELVAKEPDKYVRVNKDDLRDMLHDGKWSRGREKTVLEMRDAMVRTALFMGKTPIVDDTNFAPKHEAKMKEIADYFDADVEVKFFDVNVKDCIQRDLKRERPVGKDVILEMWHRYLCKTKEFDFGLPKSIIVDLDGTLAHAKNRGFFDWKKVGTDSCDRAVANLVRLYRKDGYKIVLLSGRDSVCRLETEDWLLKFDIPYDHLIMRAENDMRKDYIIKEELYKEHVEGKYAVEFVVDDRSCVIRAWQQLGLKVFNVGFGYEF